MNTALARFFLVPAALLILASCIPATQTQEQPRKSSLADGLVVHLALDGSLEDQSGHHNDGVSTQGAAPGPDRHGRANQGYLLDGSGGISVADSASLDLSGTQAVTLSAWVYFTEAETTGMAVVSRDGNLTTQGLYLGVVSSGGTLLASFRFHGQDTAWHEAAGTSVLPRNQWVLLTATHDGATGRIYVNGQGEGSVPLGANWTPEQGLAIGYFDSITAGPLSRMVGRIDDVRVYNRALTAAEVQRLALDS